MTKILKNILRKLKNLFNSSNLKKDKNYLLEINKVEADLKALEDIKNKNIYLILSNHKRVLNTYYPHITNKEVKTMFEQKLLLIEQHLMYINRIMGYLEELEVKFNQKLRKLLNKQDIEDNYELTIYLNSEYNFFNAMWKDFNYIDIILDFKHTLKILNINIDQK